MALQEAHLLDEITKKIEHGKSLSEILDYIYEAFQAIMPYDRIGFSLIEEDGTVIRSVWCKSCRGNSSLDLDYKASLKDSRLPPIDQNCCTFFNRYVIDEGYEGLAFEEEGARCAGHFSDPRKKVMIMGNHGVLVIGENVAETFNRMYYFERACETYIRALQTGMELRVLPDDVAEKTAQELEGYPNRTSGTWRS